MDGRIYYLIEQLNRDIGNVWSVDRMATLTELSVPRLQRLFKVETGSSPMSFLKDLRLERARLCLEDGFSQIKQIAIFTGLTDESHFTRDFKTKFGVTPTEYRKRIWCDRQSGTHSVTKELSRDMINSFRQ